MMSKLVRIAPLLIATFAVPAFAGDAPSADKKEESKDKKKDAKKDTKKDEKKEDKK